MEDRAVLIETKKEFMIVVEGEFLGPYPTKDKEQKLNEVLERLSKVINEERYMQDGLNRYGYFY